MQTIRVARYLRVSKTEQNLALQSDETATVVQGRGWKLVETYEDHGISGAKDRRPALDKMMADARKRKFDLVVVYKADRLFRSLKHMVTSLDELAALGVGFVSTSEPFDTSTPAGKLLLHLVAALGEFERSLLIERVRCGVAAARRRGVRLGRRRRDLTKTIFATFVHRVFRFGSSPSSSTWGPRPSSADLGA